MIQPPASLVPPPVVELRARHDGWTPDRQRGFVEALTALRSVTGAAAVVGMSVRSAYKLRQHPAAAAFRTAWDAALVRPVATAASAPTLVERVLARQHIVRARGGGFDAQGGPVKINRPVPARALVRLLDRTERQILRAQKNASSSPS